MNLLRLASSRDTESLNELFFECSLRPKYQYYFCEGGTYRFEPSNNTVHRRDFVSVDEDTSNIIGFISYQINISSKRAHSFGIINFEIGNLTFIRDLMKVIVDIFEVYNFNSLTWNCFLDNPAVSGYKKLAKRLGGKQVGHSHQVERLLDGNLHDTLTFEVLRADYLLSNFYTSGKSSLIRNLNYGELNKVNSFE